MGTRGPKLNTNPFSHNLFRHPPGYPGQNPRTPQLTFLFPWASRDIPSRGKPSSQDMWGHHMSLSSDAQPLQGSLSIFFGMLVLFLGSRLFFFVILFLFLLASSSLDLLPSNRKEHSCHSIQQPLKFRAALKGTNAGFLRKSVGGKRKVHSFLGVIAFLWHALNRNRRPPIWRVSHKIPETSSKSSADKM